MKIYVEELYTPSKTDEKSSSVLGYFNLQVESEYNKCIKAIDKVRGIIAGGLTHEKIDTLVVHH